MSLMVFGAGWCSNCKVLKQQLERDNIEFEYVDCDSDVGSELASDLGIRGLPTTVVLNNGVEVKRVIGVKPTSEYTAVL